jgi:hypothetical protein
LRLALLTGCIVGKSASRKGDHDHATEQEGFFRLHLFLRSPVNILSSQKEASRSVSITAASGLNGG